MFEHAVAVFRRSPNYTSWLQLFNNSGKSIVWQVEAISGVADAASNHELSPHLLNYRYHCDDYRNGDVMMRHR